MIPYIYRVGPLILLQNGFGSQHEIGNIENECRVFSFDYSAKPIVEMTHQENNILAKYIDQTLILENIAVGQFSIDEFDNVRFFIPYYASIDQIEGFIRGPVASALAQRAGFVPLHSSSVGKDGKAVLFLGNSGDGKSTMSAALSGMGWDFVTDDVAIIFRAEGKLRVMQSSTRTWLLPDSIEGLGLSGDNVRADGKSAHNINDTQISSKIYDLTSMFRLEFAEIEQPEIRAICRGDDIAGLLKRSIMPPATPVSPETARQCQSILSEFLDQDFIKILRRPKRYDQISIVSRMVAASLANPLSQLLL